ncbi:MAG: alpha/beta fold hydrolase [Planctomycetota bacterium]
MESAVASSPLPPEIAAEFPFARHVVEVPAGRLAYVDEGPRGAPPIVCVHGNPTWSFLFRRIVRAHSREHRVVALDHIGCGLSDKPANATLRLVDHVDNLERLVLALGLERITLLVHDWGGAIGFGFARRHPELVARLVITNTAAFPSTRMPWRIRACRTPIVGPFLIRRMNAFAGLATRMAMHRPERLGATAKAGLLFPYRNAADRAAIASFVSDIPMSPAHPSYAELAATGAALQQFRDRPALVIWGERDFCFTPAFREEWQRHLPNAEVVKLASAGHYLFEEAPDEIERALSSFFARHPLP